MEKVGKEAEEAFRGPSADDRQLGRSSLDVAALLCIHDNLPETDAARLAVSCFVIGAPG
jgi:hypothetical protein